MSKRASINQALHYRNYQRVRSRALSRLAQAHQAEYKQYLQEERNADQAMGKTWIDIDGATGSPITIQSYKDATESADQPCEEPAHQSYYAGEEE